jgi:hypothetical protein
MIRERFDGYDEETPRRPRKRNGWLPIVLVVLVALAVAHLAGLTGPLAGLALPGRSHTPGWRLVGDWQSDDDPMFRRVCHLAPKEGYRGTGIYMADAGRGMHEVIFKITAEDRSGSHVEMSEFLPGSDANYHVRYSIATDGQTMTREYEGGNGKVVTCQYRYLGPPSQDPPRSFR